ncbi:MAG: alpha/beta hydrolase, partial [Albidovulum sp.]
EGAITGYGLDPARMTFLGYSNGANLLGAIIQLHPDAVRNAILLRSLQALERPPAADLEGVRVLMLTGARDPYGRGAPALEAALSAGGADLTAKILNAGHEMTVEDISAAQDWLRGIA